MDPEAYFYRGLVAPSDAHSEWAYFRAKFRRNAIGAHRGSGKSTIIAEEFSLMNLLTVPRSYTMMVLSTEGKVEGRFDTLMQQIEHNPRIREDFGELKPPKTGGVWNRHHMRLMNGALLKGFGFTSDALRGERPEFIIVDDPEYDPKEGTNVDRVVADMETVLFKVLLPMLRPGSDTRIFWIGTPVHKRLFLWKLIKGVDPRMSPDLWNRKLYPIVDNKGKIFWPAEYSKETIELRRRELGDHFLSEMMCDPGSMEEKPLQLDPELTSYHMDIKEEPPNYADPFNIEEEVTWNDCVPTKGSSYQLVPRSKPLSEVYKSLTRAITVDFAPTTKATSDYSVIHVMGMDRLNQLWSLDCWAGRVRSDRLIQLIWEMAERWVVRVVGVEAVAIQDQFACRVREAAHERMANLGYIPQVLPIKYRAGVTKDARVGALEWRFRNGLVKLPMWRDAPGLNNFGFRSLFSQIRGYTPNVEGLGLEHDDCVDTLAMYPSVLKGGPRPVAEIKKDGYMDMLRAGQLTTPEGMPVHLGIDINKIDPQTMRDLVWKAPDDENPRVSGHFDGSL